MKQPSAEIPKNMREECSQKGRTDEPEIEINLTNFQTRISI